MGKTINRLNVGDRVKQTHGGRTVGTIEAVETELGPDHASVRWDGNTTGFCVQIPKENLVKVD
jgi:hypothetical protein